MSFVLTLRFSVILMTFLLSTGCSNRCNSPLQNIWGSVCRNLDVRFLKQRSSNSATCGGANTRQIQVNCAPGSGTNGYCQSISDQAPIYFLLVPNNASGAFIDSAAGLLSNCGDLWSALSSATPPTDLSGVFSSGSLGTDLVSCTNGGGCTASPTGCLAGWDSSLAIPTSTAASIPNGNYLACGFIDTPSLGTPPQTGLASISSSTTFLPITVSGTIILNAWGDY